MSMARIPPFESCVSLIIMVVLSMLILFVVIVIGLWGLFNLGYIDEYKNLMGYGLIVSCMSATGIVYMTHLITNEQEITVTLRREEKVSEEGTKGN